MFPIGDDDEPGGAFAIVTYALIALNVLAHYLGTACPASRRPDHSDSMRLVHAERSP